MDFLQTATDDQIALLGCFVALAASALLMYVSVYLSRTQRRNQVRQATSRTWPLTERGSLAASETSQRKVA